MTGERHQPREDIERTEDTERTEDIERTENIERTEEPETARAASPVSFHPDLRYHKF